MYNKELINIKESTREEIHNINFVKSEDSHLEVSVKERVSPQVIAEMHEKVRLLEREKLNNSNHFAEVLKNLPQTEVEAKLYYDKHSPVAKEEGEWLLFKYKFMKNFKLCLIVIVILVVICGCGYLVLT